jgi:hypothetical protein
VTSTSTLRCTSRLLALLGMTPSLAANPPHSEDDWYANMFWVARKKCLLVTHAGTLFSAVAFDIKKADITPIGQFVSSILIERCANEGIRPALLGVDAVATPLLARTSSRSVLAVMSQMQIEIAHISHSPRGHTRLDPFGWNHFLNRALRRQGRDYATPLDLVQTWDPETTRLSRLAARVNDEDREASGILATHDRGQGPSNILPLVRQSGRRRIKE